MNWSLLANSIVVGAIATGMAAALGIVVALFVSGLGNRGRLIAFAVAAMAFAMPPFVVVNAWLSLLGPAGVIYRFLPFNVASLVGTAWLLALLLWPVTMFASVGAWQRLGPDQFNLDPLLRSTALVRWLLLPAARSGLGPALVLTLVLALNNFAVPAVLQVKVLPVEVYVHANTSLDYRGALFVSWPLIAAPVLLLAFLHRREFAWPRVAGSVTAALWRERLGQGWFVGCGAMALATGVLAAAFPATQIVFSHRAWFALGSAWATGQEAFVTSACTAGGSAALAVLIGLMSWRVHLGLLTWLLLLVPGVVLGILMIQALNRPPFFALSRGIWIMIFGLTIRYLAVGWTGAVVSRRAVDRDLTDAGQLDGATRWELFRHVCWPQMSSRIAAVWYLLYLLCLWDVETLVFIVPPGGETLALRIFNLLHYGHNPQVNALCLLLLVLAALPPILWLSLGRFPRSRVQSGGPRGRPDRALPMNLALPRKRGTLAGGRSAWSAALSGSRPVRVPPSGGSVVDQTARFMVPMRSKGETLLPMNRCPLPSPSPSGMNGRRLRWALALLVAAAASVAGCAPRADANAEFRSRLFGRVEVLGARGTGSGQFNKPRSVAVDREDHLYVVDMTGRVQKFASDGAWLLFWQMPETDLGKPKGMGIDKEGRLIVIEPHYSRLNHFDSDGTLAHQWGEHGTNAGQLTWPRAVVANRTGELYVSEYGVVDRVQHFSADGSRLLSAFGRFGAGPGEFNRPEGLGSDAQGRLYVADSCNHRVQILAPDGRTLRSHGHAGKQPGQMSYPYDVCVDSVGNQFVCEFGNSRVQVFDSEDKPIEIVGGPGHAPGQFNNPWSIALDSVGNLYVADAGNDRVQKLIRRDPLAARR